MAMEDNQHRYQSNQDLTEHIAQMAAQNSAHHIEDTLDQYYFKLQNQVEECLRVLEILFYTNTEIPLDNVAMIQNTYLTTQLTIAKFFCWQNDPATAAVILNQAKKTLFSWGNNNYSRGKIEKKISEVSNNLISHPNVNPFAMRGRPLKDNYFHTINEPVNRPMFIQRPTPITPSTNKMDLRFVLNK